MTADDLGDRARLISLTVADQPSAWEAAGFSVSAHPGARGTIHLGDTAIVLTGGGERSDIGGIQGWTVGGLDAPAGPGLIDGIVTEFEACIPSSSRSGSDEAVTPHPNGALGIDHVVIITPDLDRTTAAFVDRGLGVRRIRDTESYGAPMRQAFLRIGPSVVEVVSGNIDNPDPGKAQGPAQWFGMALDVDDLDLVSDLLGDGLGAIKPAVQPGRRIATIRHKTYGMTVAVALMDSRG